MGALKDDPELEKIPTTMLSIVDDRHIGYCLGASDYLTKPIDRENLLASPDDMLLNRGPAETMPDRP